MEIGDSIAEMLLTELYTNMPGWMERGSCSDTDLDPLLPEDETAFKELCNSCPVFQACEQKYRDIHSGGRTIDLGIFHAKNYGDRT